MKRLVALLLLIACVIAPTAARATDVDGPDDCQRQIRDFGDAPEGIDAYPGVLGRFPTCLNPGPVGTMDLAPGCTAVSTPPGPAGFVMHLSVPGEPNYWLGCAAAAPMGVDSELDGKVSAGGPLSACNPNVTIDCTETVGALTFGQDECYGSDDAGIASAITFAPCSATNIMFKAHNCGPGRSVFLNVLVDYNQDGDWNDVAKCGTVCIPEWALHNVVIDLPSGCSTLFTPAFMVGPNAGKGWMRITISDQPVPNDFPWNGSASIAGQALLNGETEDYPVTIAAPTSCHIGYIDFGDAPEGIPAYENGVIGHFPTCFAPNPGGAADVSCPPLALPPGPDAGWVRHIQPTSDPNAFWLGCNAANPLFVDSDIDGKVGPAGGASACSGGPVDCTSLVEGGYAVGQDECYGDNVDAGIAQRVQFPACGTTSFQFNSYLCSTTSMDVFLNVLVDWNGDGDWNDDAQCVVGSGQCASEWAVKNVALPLNPGCQTLQTPPIQAGPRAGAAWMRVTLTRTPVPDDFPSNGSGSVVTTPHGTFIGGETEDYVTDIVLPSGAVGDDAAPAGGLALAISSANPSSSAMALRFTLTRSGRVSLVAYDAAGRRVRVLARGEYGAGAHSVGWDLRDDRGGELPAGVYLVKMEAEGRVLTQRLVRM